MQLQPCLWGVYEETPRWTKLVGLTLVHVDDFIVSGNVQSSK